MSLPMRTGRYIDGAWREPQVAADPIPVVGPATTEVIEQVADAGTADMDLPEQPRVLGRPASSRPG